MTLNGAFAGYGYWSQHPGGDINGDGREDYGDSATVYDGTADGWGLEVTVSGGRGGHEGQDAGLCRVR